MPYFRFAGLKWRISADDFFFPFVLTFVIEVFWLLLLTVFLVSHTHQAFVCRGGQEVKLFYYFAISLTIFKIIHSGLFTHQSGRGSVRQSELRRFVPHLLWLHLLISVPMSLIIYGYGIYMAFFKETNCKLHTIIIIKCVCIAGIVVASISLSVAFLMTIGPCFSFSDNSHGSRDGWCARFWMRAAAYLCCTKYDESVRDAFKNVNNVLYAYFHEYDLAPSDLAAGIVLLNQHEPIYELHTASTSAPTEEWCRLEHIAYFAKYACSSYGWLLEVFQNPITCCCHLAPHIVPCASCVTNNRTGLCGCDYAAVLHATGIREKDILHYNTANGVGHAAYLVVKDDDRECIVVAVRGTFSLSDALTDLQVAMVQVDSKFPDFQAHAGMVQSAQAIAQTLAGSVLPDAFAESPDYRLVIVGHSLGAGVAALLGHLLRAHYPRLVCYCYSPPLQVATSSFAEYCKQFVCCCTLGDDVITHLNLSNMIDYQERLLCALYLCDKPKHRVLLQHVISSNSSRSSSTSSSRGNPLSTFGSRSSSSSSRLLHRGRAAGYSQLNDLTGTSNALDNNAAAAAADVVDAEAVGSVSILADAKAAFQCKRPPEAATLQQQSFYKSQPQAVFPGHMLHIVHPRTTAALRYPLLRRQLAAAAAAAAAADEDGGGGSSRGRGLVGIWSSPLYFKQLRVSTSALRHHQPNCLLTALHQLMEDCVQPIAAAGADKDDLFGAGCNFGFDEI